MAYARSDRQLPSDPRGTKRGGGGSRATGLPIGNLTSQLFANVYLNELDQFIKHDLHIKHYVRYTDDFIVITDDPAKLEALLQPIRDFLRERLRLELHPDKVEIRQYRKGVDFLGYVAFPRFRLMRKNTEKRMYRKLKTIREAYQKGLVPRERAEASLGSYLGLLTHADAYRLSEKLKNDFWMKMGG